MLANTAFEYKFIRKETDGSVSVFSHTLVMGSLLTENGGIRLCGSQTPTARTPLPLPLLKRSPILGDSSVHRIREAVFSRVYCSYLSEQNSLYLLYRSR